MAANDNQRIANHTAVLMIAVAAFFDVLQLLFAFIPGVNILLGWLINICALMTFGLWFLIHGKIFSRNPFKKGILAAAAAMFELVAGFLPTWIVYVALTVWMTRREDAQDAARQQQLAQQLARQQKRSGARNDNRRAAAA